MSKKHLKKCFVGRIGRGGISTSLRRHSREGQAHPYPIGGCCSTRQNEIPQTDGNQDVISSSAGQARVLFFQEWSSGGRGEARLQYSGPREVTKGDLGKNPSSVK